MDWKKTFPRIFQRDGGSGFDCVIGNPPWERLKLQEREFFAFSAPEIASAASAADRRKLIAVLKRKKPALFEQYEKAKAAAEQMLDHVRDGGEYPLTGRGDINTYMVFAELALKIVRATGRVGLLVPSGIATDATTKEFFGDLVASKRLTAVYDFVNRLGLFPDVEGRMKFCILLLNGAQIRSELMDFVFWAERMADLSHKNRHIKLTAKDLKLMNPNTLTCPIFRNNRDAELTRGVYGRVPILIDQARQSGGNPWGIRFLRMFDQTNDAEHFVTPDKLEADKFKPIGNRWIKGKREFLPLFEAKMTRDYDHRASKVVMNTKNWYMNYSAESASLVEHQNPEFLPAGRWWADAEEVQARSPQSAKVAAIGFHDIARANDTRTMVACMIPFAAASNTVPLLLNDGGLPWRRFCCLLGNMNSVAFDFVVRQKAGGAHLNFFIVEQIPTLTPDTYDDLCPWEEKQTLEKWISDRVLKLTCTSDDMRPLAKAAGFKEGVHKWKEAERADLRAELDAAYFHLYGINRNDAEYILSTFQGMTEGDEGTFTPNSVASRVLDAYDALAASGRIKGTAKKRSGLATN